LSSCAFAANDITPAASAAAKTVSIFMSPFGYPARMQVLRTGVVVQAGVADSSPQRCMGDGVQGNRGAKEAAQVTLGYSL
jgi:hypothetical protein